MSLKQRKESIPRLPLDRLGIHDRLITEEDFGESTRRTIALNDESTLKHWIERLRLQKQELLADPEYEKIQTLHKALMFPQDAHNLDVYAHHIACVQRTLQEECFRFGQLNNIINKTIEEFDREDMRLFIEELCHRSEKCGLLVESVFEEYDRVGAQPEVGLKFRRVELLINECVKGNEELLRRVEYRHLISTNNDISEIRLALDVAARLCNTISRNQELLRNE